MAKELAPAFQFYPKDFLSDSNVVPMTTEEVGAYWLLVSHCWLDQSLPNDMEHLATLARCTPGRFERVWRRVSKCFTLDAGGRWVHTRLERIRIEHETNRAKRQEAGRLGGLAKSLGNSRGSPSNATAMLSSSSSSPSASATAERSARVPKGFRSIVSAPNPRIVFHGKVEVWDWMHSKLKARLGTPDAELKLSAFYVKTNEQWEASGSVPSGGDWDIWRRAFDAEFGSSDTAVDEAAAARARFQAMGNTK